MLKDKTILVAGAGGLIGSALVVGLLENGAKVIAADIDVEAAGKRIEALGAKTDTEKLHLQELDIVNEQQVKEFFKAQVALDGAINATYPRNSSYGTHFFDVNLSSFNENLSLHLGSSFLFSQQCAAYFKQHQTPFSLVSISSIYGISAPDFSIYEGTSMTMPIEYAAIKSALLHMNKYIVAYINNSDFRVNAISPGGVFDNQPEAFLSAYKKKTMGAGMLQTQDLIGAVVFLLSDQSRYVTGQNITIDDGFTL